MSSLRESAPNRVFRLGRPPAPARRPAGVAEEPSAPAAALGAHRTISIVAALGLFWPLAKAWSDIVAMPSAGLAVVALSAGGLWLVGAIATAKTEPQLERLDNWLLLLGLMVLLAWAVSVLNAQSSYSTDEAAFEQGAANLLLHGHDPYGANLANALAAFGTPTRYFTYTLSGGIVSSFGYPALPLLIVAPIVELTNGGQAVPIADVIVLMAATVGLYKVLPKEQRGAAVILCIAIPILGTFALSGLNAVLAIAALLPVAARWTRTGERGSLRRADRLAALCLGLAMATNQLAWFIAPFLLGGIYLLRRGALGAPRAWRVTLNYLGWAAAAFLVVNGPFIVWNPGAWVGAVAAPVTQHAIPYGQGLVGLTLFLRIGGGNIAAYDYAAALLYLALLVAYLVHFRKLARTCFLLPLAALFVSGRSLSEYWMVPIPVIAASVICAQERAIAGAAQLVLPLRRPISRSAGPVVIAGLLLAAATWVGIALATPQPLRLRILSARSNRARNSVQELRVLVRNGSAQTLRPHFATNVTGQAVLWNITRGPAQLAPGRAATYRLAAPDASSMVPNGATLLLEAFTNSPRTISSSAPFVHRGPVPGYW